MIEIRENIYGFREIMTLGHLLIQFSMNPHDSIASQSLIDATNWIKQTQKDPNRCRYSVCLGLFFSFIPF
jgi:hypothetical protein